MLGDELLVERFDLLDWLEEDWLRCGDDDLDGAADLLGCDCLGCDCLG